MTVVVEKGQQPTIDPILSLLYGGVAGCVAKTFIAPFDRVKIHFQIAHPELDHHRGKITGVFGAVRQIYKRAGFFGLFRGHSVTLARIFPYAAINFAAFERFKILLHADSSGNSSWPWRKLISGSLAGTLAVSVTYPFDIIRARIAYDLAHKTATTTACSSNSSAEVIISAIRRLSAEGKHFRGFYQGFFPTILGIIPYAGVSFFTFETLKQHLRTEYDVEKLSVSQSFFAGLFAGALGQTVAYPLDVLRRRMQLYRITDHLPIQHYNSGLIHAFKSILKSHGLAKGIFSGLSINYIKVAPASGISFLIYEQLKNRCAHVKLKD